MCIRDREDEISAVKIDLNHNNSLLEEENKRLDPLRDKRVESLAKLQKLNIDMAGLDEEEARIKSLQLKLQNSLMTITSDIEREKSISMDASLNEKRIVEEKDELLKTEKQLLDTETLSYKNVGKSKEDLKSLQDQLDQLINNCLLYTSPSPRDGLLSRMPSSA